jgi:hypothetical protein
MLTVLEKGDMGRSDEAVTVTDPRLMRVYPWNVVLFGECPFSEAPEPLPIAIDIYS